MRVFLVVSLFCSTAHAQEFFTNDKMVRPASQPSADPMVREPTSLPFGDANVRTPPDDDVDPRWDGHTDADGHLHGKRKHHRRHKGERDSGFSISFHGGAFGRATDQYRKIGDTLGPASDPSRFGGMFVLQATADLKRHLRIGGDFTYGATRAFGVGNDFGGIAIRQSVQYHMITGGVLVEGVLPVRDILEFSLGTSVGGGGMKVDANSARVDSFADLGTDLRSIPKTARLELDAPVLHVKPSFGVRARFTKSSIAAFDVRVGVNVYWVPRGTMRMWDDLQVYGSPDIVEIQPFITAGVAFGDWASR